MQVLCFLLALEFPTLPGFPSVATCIFGHGMIVHSLVIGRQLTGQAQV
jgi:hypothetical protein